MKNRKLFTFIALMFCACMAIAQHENCNHGDAPDASLQSKISDFVQVDEMSSHAINLKTAKAEAKNINKIVTAIGKIENIPPMFLLYRLELPEESRNFTFLPTCA